MDIDSPDVDVLPTPTVTDYVKWQGSQTTHQALNRLIESSTDDLLTSRAVPTSIGWHSYDLLPALPPRTRPIPPSSSSKSSSSRHTSLRIPPSRARALEAQNIPQNAPSRAEASEKEDKAKEKDKNPLRFLDILKSVSAKLDENASHQNGMAGHATTYGTGSALASLGSVSSACTSASSSNATPRPSKTYPPSQPRRAALSQTRSIRGIYSETESTSSSTTLSSTIRPQRSLLPSTDNPRSSHNANTNTDAIPMDVDPTQTFDHFPRKPPEFETPSQAKMPPPLPLRIAPSAAQKSRLSEYSNTPPAILRTPSFGNPGLSTPTLTSASSSSSTPNSVKPAAPTRYHPLLTQKTPPTTSPVFGSGSIRLTPAPAPATKPKSAALQRSSTAITTHPPPPVNPPIETHQQHPQSQAPRKPVALGMRRTHTLPSKLSSASSFSSLSTSTTSMKNRAFKPPFLSTEAARASRLAQIRGCLESEEGRSEGQKQGQALNLPVPVAGNAGSARGVGGPKLTRTASAPLGVVSGSSGSSFGSAAGFSPAGSGEVGGSIKTSSFGSSSTSSSMLGSRSSSGYTSNTTTTSPLPDTNDKTVSKDEDADDRDEDADSSFADISFDMDALEETMKMYD